MKYELPEEVPMMAREPAVAYKWTPTISQETFERDYMTLEESSAQIDELITSHFHSEK